MVNGQFTEFNLTITEESLVKELLQDYNKNRRPLNKVDLYVFFKLKQLVSIDEKNQIMTTSSYVGVYWFDARFIWNPADWNGLEQIMISAKSIWLPDIIVENSGNSNIFFTINDYQLTSILANGVVYISLPAISLPTRCKINVRKYPFDQQTCSIKFGSLSQSRQRIWTYANASTFDMNNYQKNMLWDLISINVTSDFKSDRLSYLENSSTRDIHFDLLLKRKPLYFMVNGIFPCLVLNVVTLLAFAIPFAVQVSLSMTTFLTFSVYSLRVASDIPMQSEFLPMISLYFILSSVFTLLSLFWFVIANYFMSKKYVPKILILLLDTLDLKQKLEERKRSRIDQLSETNHIEKNAENIDENDQKKNKPAETQEDTKPFVERKKKTTEELVGSLNTVCFMIVFLTMFISNMYIWLFLSTPD